MSKQERLGLVGFFLLAGLTLVTALLLERNILPNQLLYGQFEADLARIVFFSGLSLMAGLALVFGLIRRWHRRLAEVRQEQRLAYQKRYNQFLQRFNHEVKNPLVIITLALANLRQSANLGDEQALSVERMHSQVRRLQKLIGALRWLSELGAHEIDQELVDVSAVLEEARMVVEAAAPGKNEIGLSIQQVPWVPGQVRGDRDLLLLAFSNLLENALKFTGERDKIVVRATEDGNMVAVEVADTGIGIPEADLPHVCEELYRGQNALATAGSGMGLALVKRIVSLHGGHLALTSRVGQGTVVRVRLPLASSREG